MKCPFCGHPESRVIDSRATDEHTAIRRRRECAACSDRFTTYERIEEVPLVVIKKNGEKEIFNRNKIITGLLKACEKRGIPRAKLEEIACCVEQDLRNRMEYEIPSLEIGEAVMAYLLDLDEVAYVRFASVYRHFTDINKFKQELERLTSKKTKKEQKGAY